MNLRKTTIKLFLGILMVLMLSVSAISAQDTMTLTYLVGEDPVNLAMTQALIVLSIFLARFRITAETKEVRPVGCGYLLKSSPDLMVRLRER